MAQTLFDMITLFVKNNKKYLNRLDGYLSFENVKSIELSQEDECKLKAHWIDGVQLKQDGTIDVWLSTDQSEDIFHLELSKLPKSLHAPLLKKLTEAVSHKDFR